MASKPKAPQASPEFRLFVTLDTGETHEMPGRYLLLGAQHFAAVTVQEGWWHGNNWFPPHRLKGIRTEPLS